MYTQCTYTHIILINSTIKMHPNIKSGVCIDYDNETIIFFELRREPMDLNGLGMDLSSILLN